MEPKKNPKADLERKRGVYFQIGLIAALALTWIALEWKSYEKIVDLGELMTEEIEEEIIPITERQIKPPPPPPPEQLVIVEDKEEIEEEMEVKDQEVTEQTQIQPIKEVENIEEEQIFTIVEEMPKFGGGDAELLNYLARNIRYPEMAKESGISGTVYLKFVVNEKGEVGDVTLMRGIGGGCDEEATRVVKSMPRWQPGKQRGKPVKVWYNLPVRFVLR